MSAKKREVPDPVIEEVDYNSDVRQSLTLAADDREKQDYLLSYPTVYIIRGQAEPRYRVYVGESNDIVTRTAQHIQDAATAEDWQKFRDGKTKLLVIGNPHFNKSLTLDIENQLMDYLMGAPKVERLINGRGNPQGEYYPSSEREDIFQKVWTRLGVLNSELFPTQETIIRSALFKASPFHKLTLEQLQAEQKILDKIHSVFQRSQTSTGNLIVVSGDAGSGKTVLLSAVFYKFVTEFKMKMHVSDAETPSVQLLVNHDQQLKVYEQIAQKLGIQKKGASIISKPTHFINSRKGKKPTGIVLVDEAHLLWTQGKQAYRGKNQMSDLLKEARVVIAIFDPHQMLTTEEYWEKTAITNMVNTAKLNGNYISLAGQLRMQASDNTIQWIHDLVFEQRVNFHAEDSQYDIQVMSSPQALEAAIREKAADSSAGLSRILATFDWPYKDKGGPEGGGTWNVTVGNWSMPWNKQLPIPKKHRREINKLPWAEQPQTINEVGSTYTVQGFDLNYAGVIIGPTVKYRNDRILFDPEASENKKATQQRTMADGSKSAVSSELLRNELNVLLTRGVHGLYIYAVDKELQRALTLALSSNRAPQRLVENNQMVAEKTHSKKHTDHE